MTDAPRDPGRREALKTAGLLAAGVLGGAVLSSDAAEAADNDTIKIGTGNTGTKMTTLTAPDQDDPALNVVGDFMGVAGEGFIGVAAFGDLGVAGLGFVGAQFEGVHSSLSLVPQATAGPATDESLKGDILVDSAGVLWLCVADGTPGTWIRVSHGGMRLLSSPVRFLDTRNTGGGGMFTAGQVRELTVTGSGVPANAIGVFGSLVVVGTVGRGFGAIYPFGGTRGGTSNILWAGANPRVASYFVSRVGSRKLYIEIWKSSEFDVDMSGFVLLRRSRL
ncbi:MAG: hypothetical protein ACRDKJ_04990 [Actinomycetota bacterium]